MRNLLTDKTVSLEEFEHPGDIIKKAGDKPIAILNGGRVEGYFVPAVAVNKISFEPADPDEVDKAIKESIARNKAILDYLKDR